MGHLKQTANSLEKTLILRKIESIRKRGQQRMKWLDDITDSVDAELEAFFVYFACKLSDMCFSNIFSQCLTCLFIPLMEFYFKKPMLAQWYRIRLSMQETWVQFLIWEDFTCHGATKPLCHSHSACALEPRGCNDRGHMPWSPRSTRKATTVRSLSTSKKSGPHSPQLEKTHAQQQTPTTV